MIGKMVAHYKILEEIGQGGLGVVYKAEDTKLKRTVALKFLKATALVSEEQKTRFIREAQAAAALSHPSICTIHEIGEHEGRAFIAMAYIEGQGLDERIRQGPLPVDEALSIAIQVGEGLQEAHEKGIIHRDIKSGNIRITPKGRARILDFGLARMPGQTVVTQEGISMGTVAYMSPEQARGERLDQRTDIWSFGVMLYEMLVGRLPFKGDNANAVIYSILHDTPDPITGLRTGVPVEIERIVVKALAKDTGERYQHMDDMLADLRTLRRQYETGTVEIASVTTGLERSPGRPVWQELGRRQVLLPVILYVIVGIAVIALVGYAVDNFPISPKLPQFVLVLFATLLPAVALLAYSRSRTGKPRWTKTQLIGVPLNIIGSALILLILLRGEPLATTTMVTTTDEEGRRVDVEIPRQEFRKRIGIFYFHNESGDSSLDWLQYAVPRMLYFDLLQDIYIDVSAGFLDELKDAGFRDGVGAPVALMRQIAARNDRPYFVGGSITSRGEDVVITSTLYRTGRAEPIAAKTVAGTNVAAMVDEMSAGMKVDLDIPDYHIESTADHALTEILTDSPAAIREFGLGMQGHASNDYEAAARHLQQAVDIDPTFALAHWELFRAYNKLGRPDESTRSLLAAMEHIYKLPTFYQYIVRSSYHEHSEDLESALETVRDWVKLYPQSVDAHELMAAYLEALGDLDGAIDELNAILDLDPDRHNLLQQLGDLHARNGDFEQGLRLLDRFRELYPEDYRSYAAIGALHRASGDYGKAKEFYLKAKIYAPERIDLRIAIADLESKTGNFDRARQELLDAQRIARQPSELSSVYNGLKDWYKNMGQIDKAEEYLDLYVEEASKEVAPIPLALAETFFRVELYAYTENHAAALRTVEKAEALLGDVPLLRFFPKYARIWYYRLAEDRSHVTEAEELLAEMDDLLEKNPTASLEAMALFARSGVYALKNEFKEAAESAEKAIPLLIMLPQDQRIFLQAFILGDLYRSSGQLDKAEEAILSGLSQEPFQPFLHALLGLAYKDMGRREDALLHLRKARDIWKDADPDFKPPMDPRPALEELDATASN